MVGRKIGGDFSDVVVEMEDLGFEGRGRGREKEDGSLGRRVEEEERGDELGERETR